MTPNSTAQDHSTGTPHILQKLKIRLLDVVRRIIPGSPPNWEAILLAASVALMPLFYLTLKNWTEAILVILAVLSAYGIIQSRLSLRTLFPDPSSTWIFAALALPIVAVFISILLRGDLRWSLWEQNLELLNGPSRLFLAALAFLWLSYQRVRFLDALQIVLPISIIITTFFATAQQPDAPGRYTTALLDLCAFSQQICLLGLLQLFLLIFRKPASKLVLGLSVVAIVLAAKMGIDTGSRGGWIAVPPLLVIAALLYKGNKAKILGLLLVASVAVGGVLVTNQKFRDRLTSIYSETAAWFAGDATAGGSGRLTIMAISWELIQDNPIKGYASQDNLWRPVYRMDHSRYLRKGFTYEDTTRHRYTLCKVGEHNQYLYAWLINGVLGLISQSLVLLVPLVVFITRLRGSQGDAYAAAALGIGFVVAFMVFGLTQGPFNYKVITSFYGFVIAGLAASYAPPTSPKVQARPSAAVKTTVVP